MATSTHFSDDRCWARQKFQEAIYQSLAELKAKCRERGIKRVEGQDVERMRGGTAVYHLEMVLGLELSDIGRQYVPIELPDQDRFDTMERAELERRLRNLGLPAGRSAPDEALRRRLRLHQSEQSLASAGRL